MTACYAGVEVTGDTNSLQNKNFTLEWGREVVVLT
jgi:hypothetical protein